jgi:uncharacterized protein
MITKELIREIRRGFCLDWRGIHGVRHWARVREIGLLLATLNGAKVEVVELFAFLHDSRRRNEGSDPHHGVRASNFANELRGSLINLSDHDFELLSYACVRHSEGFTEADVTVQTCWDADRLDLGRAGIKPNPLYLCTPNAKDSILIEWAYQRSLAGMQNQ